MAESFITRAADVPLGGWNDPARGKLSWRRLVCGEQMPSEEMTGGIAYLAPGDFLKPHRHDPAEIYFIIEGRPIVTIDGREQVVEPESAIFVAPNAEHGIRNDGPGPVRFFYCFARDRFSDFEYRFPDNPT